MKVEYVEDLYLGLDDKAHTCLLPKCPKCGKYPTYNMNPCPFCGQELEYTRGENVEDTADNKR
jgi:uncharacterized OB-fold protein